MPELPLSTQIEKYLAMLSKLYEKDGNRLYQSIIVNSKIRLHEGWHYDNWNGGTYGHALFLGIPEGLFLDIAKSRNQVQQQVRDDLNGLHNFQNESIADVFLEMELIEGRDWRAESGLLTPTQRIISTDTSERIWGKEGFRLFLSHKAIVKKEVVQVKERLSIYGISCFVAHEDIHPTREWQDEIERALASMDGFVALMSADFHDSDWTDQEVGFAVARGVPIIAVRLGADPYGFIGKFQGLASNWEDAHVAIIRILIKNERVLGCYLNALNKCSSWDGGNYLSKALAGIESMSTPNIDEFINTYNSTPELRGSFGFNGGKPRIYGNGLVDLINRMGQRQYGFDSNGLIQLIKTNKAARAYDPPSF